MQAPAPLSPPSPVSLRSQALHARKQAAVSAGIGTTLPVYVERAGGGILVAGGLVMWLDQSWPDLLVGVLVAAIAAKGGFDILRDARLARRDAESSVT